MSDTTKTNTNPLTAVVLDSIHTIRGLQTKIVALREALQVSVAMLADQDKALDAARRQNHALRDELRRQHPGAEAA